MIFDANSFEGLNAGMEWAGTMIVIFVEMLRAVLAARCLIRKCRYVVHNITASFNSRNGVPINNRHSAFCDLLGQFLNILIGKRVGKTEMICA